MWRSISNAFGSFEKKRGTPTENPDCLEFSDDEICSNASAEEGLECPICWESFNIVENVPYVLWCGHTLCKHCVLGLKWASLKFSSQQVQIPFFVSCPWCSLLTFRLIYKGNLKFPSKNFFLLWMVESRNGDRVRTPSSIPGDNKLWSPRCTSVIGNSECATLHRRTHEYPGSSNNEDEGVRNTNGRERPQLSLQKSLDLFIRLSAKFPLVLVFLLIVIFALPSCAAILVLYLVITILFAFPAFLVLYFAYPALDWLAREITT